MPATPRAATPSSSSIPRPLLERLTHLLPVQPGSPRLHALALALAPAIAAAADGSPLPARPGSRAHLPLDVALRVVHICQDPATIAATLQAAEPWLRRTADSRPRSSTGPVISDRELQLLHHLAAGLSNADAARAMGLSIDTVKTYAVRLYSRLGVQSRAHAVAVGYRDHLLQVEPPATGQQPPNARADSPTQTTVGDHHR